MKWSVATPWRDVEASDDTRRASGLAAAQSKDKSPDRRAVRRRQWIAASPARSQTSALGAHALSRADRRSDADQRHNVAFVRCSSRRPCFEHRCLRTPSAARATTPTRCADPHAARSLARSTLRGTTRPLPRLPMAPRVILWHRTDLRLHDAPALRAALDLKPEAFWPVWTWNRKSTL